MLRKGILLAISCLISASLHAERISLSRAQECVVHLLQQRQGAQSRSFSSLSLYEVDSPQDMEVQIVGYGKNGFVLVGGTEAFPVILGYGNVRGKGVPHTLHGLLSRSLPVVSSMSSSVVQAKDPPIFPFNRTVRHQEAPFNGSCPHYFDESNGLSADNCLVGCVATALEQVMTYYQYPKMTLDTLFGWTTEHYTVDTVLPGRKIDFQNILDDYNSSYSAQQAKAVSDLSYYCGMAAHMNWGLHTSGAQCAALLAPMKRVFGYQYVRHLYPSDYTVNRWHELLYNELKNKRPVLYAGYTSTMQGHAFLLDGIDEGGFYHVVWGYGGNYDGYFNLDILNTFENQYTPTPNGRLMGHFCNQEALFLCPETISYEENDTLAHHNRVVVDTVVFSRPPDTGRYMTAYIKAHNVSPDTLNVSFLLSTFPLQEEVGVLNPHADHVSLTGKNLSPYETVTLTAYGSFGQTGKRILTVSTDDSAFCYRDTIQVSAARTVLLDISAKDSVIKADEAHFTFHIQNKSRDYWAGNDITYCLFEGDYDENVPDTRHWSILNLPPMGGVDDTVAFYGLKPSTRYTLLVRNRWPVALKSSFTTLSATGLPQLGVESRSESLDMQGIPVLNPRRGLYLMKKEGKYRKIFLK